MAPTSSGESGENGGSHYSRWRPPPLVEMVNVISADGSNPSGGNGENHYINGPHPLWWKWWKLLQHMPLPVSTKEPRGCGANSEVIFTISTMGVGGELGRDFHRLHHGSVGPTLKWFSPFPVLGLGANSDVISTNSTISIMGVGGGGQLWSDFHQFHNGGWGPTQTLFLPFPPWG